MDIRILGPIQVVDGASTMVLSPQLTKLLALLVVADGAFILSGSLSGDLTGQRAIVGTFTPDGTEGSAALVLNSPETGEGVLASHFKGVITADALSVTGDLIGMSGVFAGLVGTITTTGVARRRLHRYLPDRTGADAAVTDLVGP